MSKLVPTSISSPHAISHCLAATALAMLVLACGGSPQAPAAGAGDGEPLAAAPPAGYEDSVETWHSERLERLQAEEGWLTLVGLFWLEEGDNGFGSAADNALVFPASAPPRAGVLRLEGGRVTAIAEPGVPLASGGEPVSELPLESDAGGEPTKLELGSLVFYVIDREGRLGVRLKDRQAPTRLAFEGIDRFPVDPALRIEARWEPYDPPKTVETPNVLGSAFQETCPGAAVFELGGETRRMEPVLEADGSLFLVFGDRTNGDATYGGGRFVYLEELEGGRVVVDFNKAYNPPCVFTPFATCPLPRPENRLPIEVRAGEKVWGAQHG